MELKLNVRFKTLLWTRDMKQYELANKIKIPESYVSKIINGRMVPTEDQMNKIAEALGVGVNELFD